MASRASRLSRASTPQSRAHSPSHSDIAEDSFTIYMNQGKSLGLKGKELVEYVTQQQVVEREREREAADREHEREREAAEREREAAEREARERAAERESRDREGQRMERADERAKEIELAKIAIERERIIAEERSKDRHTQIEAQNSTSAVKVKLSYLEDKDDVDLYLTHFEKIAMLHGWKREDWCTILSPYLKDKAREAYLKLNVEESVDYELVKTVLLKKFHLSATSYRTKFCTAKCQPEERGQELWDRLDKYLRRWIDLSGRQRTADDISEMLLLEKFLEALPAEKARFIRDKNPRTGAEAIEVAELFEEIREAEKSQRNIQTRFSQRGGAVNPPDDRQAGRNERGRTPLREENRDRDRLSSAHRNRLDRPNVRCFNCGLLGHVSRECRRPKNHGERTAAIIERQDEEELSCRYNGRSCLKCGGPHIAYDCPDMRTNKETNSQEIVTMMVATIQAEPERMSLCEKCSALPFNPNCKVKIEGREVEGVRDTGSTVTVVDKKLVRKSAYTGEFRKVTFAKSSVSELLPVARVDIESPFVTGKIEVLTMERPVVPILIGNTCKIERDHIQVEEKIPVYASAEVSAVITRQEAKTNEVEPMKLQAVNVAQLNSKILAEEQNKDETLKVCFKKQKEKKCKDGPLYYFKNRVLRRKIVVRGKVYNQVVVPKKFRNDVMRVAHDIPLSGHLGTKKTRDRITSDFYWPGMHGSISRFCASCDSCQKCINKGRVPKAPLQCSKLVSVPFEKVAVDIIGPIHPQSRSGKRYILTMIDYATRYPEAVCLKSIDSVTVGEALWEMWTRLGIPEKILTDRGSQFTSETMTELNRLLNIRAISTTPYHAQTNGLVERFNATLKSMLKKLCWEQPTEWDRFVPALLFAYRQVPQQSSQFSPFELLFGREVRGPMQVLKKCWTDDEMDEEIRTTAEYVTDLSNRIIETCQLAKEELAKQTIVQKQYFDKKTKPRELEVGQKVLVLVPQKHNKLQLVWQGPFPVIQKFNKVNYRIKMREKEKLFHINLLKRYLERETESANGGKVAVIINEEPMEEIESETVYDVKNVPVIPLKQTEDFRNVVINQELPDGKGEELKVMIEKFEDVLTDLPGHTQLETCELKLNTTNPVRVKQYPIPHSQLETVKQEVKDMLKMEVIEETVSPYNAPIVLVKKKDGKMRFCIDYRKLNTVTEFDAEPMPDMNQIFAKLSKATYFSKIDLSKGFWQLPMREEDRAKTAFSTPSGQYQWKRMPFGMKNATAVFSRMMRKLLAPLNRNDVDNFIDDVIIATESWEDHVEALSAVFARLRETNLTVKPSKCYLGFTKLSFLGHQVGKGKIWPDAEKIEKIKNSGRPQNKTEVRAFLGLASYYRKFVPNFAEISAPLTDLTKKSKTDLVFWTEECEFAFKRLKASLSCAPVLKLADSAKPFILRTDASNVGIGAVLLQEHDDTLMPVAYASRKLNTAEKNYATIEKECLGVIWAVKKFEPYVYGTEFVIQTDHQPLRYLDKKKTENSRLMRWAIQLQEYAYHVQVIPGKENVGADYLSRAMPAEAEM